MKLTLDQISVTITVGETVRLKANAYSEYRKAYREQALTWNSSKSSVATVSPDGVVTAVSPGEAQITVLYGDASATCKVTVKGIEVTEVSLNYYSQSIREGETLNLVATVMPDNATDKTVTWSSNNTSVATVSSTGTVKGIKAGAAVITAKAGSKTATCALAVMAKPIEVTGISLNYSSISIREGQSWNLSATVTPSNATDKTVTWTSSNTSVVTVSSSGTVTGVKAGTATITAKAGSKSTTCTVTVTAAVTGVSLNKSSLSLTVGETETLTATITPSNATNKNVTWSSNATTVATVSSSGVVTAKAAGTATITVTTEDGSKTATCKVTVTEATVAVTGVSLNKSTLSLTVGETETLTATITPSNATNKNVTWSSNATTVATVSSSGLVTAKSVGTATITVKTSDGSKTATCKVTVTAPTVAVTGVSLNKSTLSLTVGETETLTATISPSNATNKNVTWSSSNTSVATVSSSGVVTAKAAGTATITVKTVDGNKTATCAVTVTASGHAYVIMGVINGKALKWATMNVGATKPEEYGDYFAWGETSPKSNYAWSTYKYGTSETTLTKYVTNSSYGTVDNKTTLEAGDDVATVNWGGSWRMPTDAEWTWLRENCTWIWTTNYNGTGVAGDIVISNVSGYEGRQIFLPAAGGRSGASVYGVGTFGDYWSSSLYTSYSYNAYDVGFNSSGVGRYYFDRYRGLSVRPVSE